MNEYKSSKNILNEINEKNISKHTEGDNPIAKKFKKEAENFSISFNKLIRKIMNLSANDNTLKIEDFVKNFSLMYLINSEINT